MSTQTAKAGIESCLAPLSPPIQQISRALHEIILATAPELKQAVKCGHPHYRQKGTVCAIVPYKHHVNLELWGGPQLSDPHRLLAGTGKVIRYVKVRSLDSINRDAIAVLIREAVDLNRNEG